MKGKSILVSFQSVVNNFSFGSLQCNGKVDTSSMSIKQLLASKGVRKVTLFLRNMGVTSETPDEPRTKEKEAAEEICEKVLKQLKEYDGDGKEGVIQVYEHTPSVSEIYGKRYAVSYININGVKTPIVFDKLSHISFNENLTNDEFKAEFSINGYELTDTNPLDKDNND